jgi:hypothetical protein
MTHYTVKFTGTKEEKLAQAFKATMDYLGDRRVFQLRDIILTESTETRRVVQLCRLACMLSGVQGYYPVHAFTLFVFKGRTGR